MKPFITIENKTTDLKISIYDNGVVYGKEQNQKLGQLNENAINEIKNILNENMYMFKTKVYYNAHEGNSYILRIRDDSNKHRHIKVVQWDRTRLIAEIIYNPKSWIKVLH